MVSARVHNKEKGFGPEFEHMALLVTLDSERYLVDVGFGEFALHPLLTRRNRDCTDPRGIFRITDYTDNFLLVSKLHSTGGFQPEYLFTETGRRLEEFYPMCHFQQTSSESHFTQKRICSLPTREGRLTLSGNMFKITVNGSVTETELKDENEIKRVLMEYFGISSPDLVPGTIPAKPMIFPKH
jgi:N-hydroxyarylamine O-acetyltransferase